jgi:hypothetical protein
LEVTLISSTPHALKVFTTPITSFEDTPNQQNITMPIGFQILSQVELMEVASVEPFKDVINQPIIESQFNLGL